MIGITKQAALTTFKDRLRRSIGFACVRAVRATLRRIGRIDQSDRDSGQCCLVFDERSQLREHPVTVPVSLLFASNPDPLTNARQIFKADRAHCALGFGNDGFADGVVDDLLKSSLFAAQSLKSAPCRLCAFALKLSPLKGTLLSDLFNRGSRIGFAIRIGRQIDNAKINTERAARFNRFGLVHIADGKQKPLAPATDQVGFSCLVCRRSSVFGPA